MRIKIATVLAGLFLTLAPRANAALEFCGYTATSANMLFSLQDPAEGIASKWIPVGGVFQGYVINAFDPKTERLSLKSPDGTVTQLALRAAPIKQTRIRVSGSIKIGVGENVEVNKATLVMGEETTFALKNGMTMRLKLSPFENYVRYDAVFEKPEPDGRVKVVSSPAVIALPGKPFALEIGELGFSFEP